MRLVTKEKARLRRIYSNYIYSMYQKNIYCTNITKNTLKELGAIEKNNGHVHK